VIELAAIEDNRLLIDGLRAWVKTVDPHPQVDHYEVGIG
jgi:hypothetical protein